MPAILELVLTGDTSGQKKDQKGLSESGVRSSSYWSAWAAEAPTMLGKADQRSGPRRREGCGEANRNGKYGHCRSATLFCLGVFVARRPDSLAV